MIQKEENVISLQSSYMGKENLKKRIAEVSLGSKGNSLHSGLAHEPDYKEDVVNGVILKLGLKEVTSDFILPDI